MLRPQWTSLVVSSSLALLLGAPLLRADVITVGPTGDFSAIQPAVNAALDDDLILVDAGTYGAVTIINKALTLVADTGADVTINAAVTVSGLAAGRTVVLAGLTVTPPSGFTQGTLALTLLGNVGAVRAVNCTFIGGGALLGAARAAVSVTDCSDTAFRDCHLEGGFTALTQTSSPPQPGASGIDALNSTVVFHGGVVLGGQGPQPQASPSAGAVGGAGLHVNDSVVFAAGTAFTGGTGGTGYACDRLSFGAYAGGTGGAAVELFGTAARFRDKSSVLTGGTGGAGSTPNPMYCPGGGSQGPDGPALIDPDGALKIIPGSLRALDSVEPIRELQSFPLSFVGEPGELVAVLFSTAPGSAYIASVHGQLMVQPMFQLQTVGTLPASGTLALSTSFPDLGPGVESALLFTQPMFLGTSGDVNLGALFTVIVLDGAF